MASCCTGVTECQQIITIGFLNTFIGNDVQNSSGVAQSVAGDSDYCPTYSELTGGTLIQNWKQGTTPNGDQDGIIIGGTYAANECVRRSDLSMKYTRFKEFSISAASTTLSACSASTTISYTHKYDRCEKKLNSTCESAAAAACTAVSDTQNSEVTLTSSNNVFTIDGFKVNVPKNNPNNNGRSNARSTTITGKITFRGTNHTDTVGITQNGLTGEYQYWYHTNTVHDKNVSCSGGPSFGCEGGIYSATAYYYQDDWDVYRWHDVCGTDYNSDTVQRNRVNDQYKVYETYGGMFPDNTLTGGPAKTDSKSWAGYGSCSWSQAYCPPPDCPTCSCDDCNCLTWGYGTYNGNVACTGGTIQMRNVTIPGTSTTYSYNAETSACTVTTAETTSSQTQSVTISCNTTTTAKSHTGTVGNIRYTITQPAGPCCTTSRTYSYETVILNCSAHENENVRAKYTATTVNNCCNTSYSYGNTDYYKVNVGCNSGSTRTLSASEKSNAPFTVKQEGNSTCCITCQCTDLTVTPTSLSWGSNETSSKTVTISSASCVTNISVTSPTYFNASLGANKIIVSPKSINTSLIARNDTVTILYNDGCSSAITLTQNGCDCGNLTASPTSLSWGSNETSSKNITLTSASCVTNISVSSPALFNASLGANKVTVSPKGANTSSSAVSNTLYITYNNNSCSSAITLTQSGCSCGDLTIGSAPGAWGYNEISAKTISLTSASCVSNITVRNTEHFNASAGTSSIIVWPKDNNSSSSAYTDTLTITYNENGSCSGSVELKQNPYVPNCDCGDVVYTPNSDPQYLAHEQNNVKIGTITLGECTSGAVEFISATPNIITDIHIDGNNVVAKLPRITEDATGTYMYKVNGTRCQGNTYEIDRVMCFCGTDNCTQQGVYDHPLYIEWDNGYCWNGVIYDSTRPSSEATKIGWNTTGDHFFVQNGELQYNGSALRHGDVLYPSGSASDWCHGEYVSGSTDSPDCPYINYYCSGNTGSRRTAEFTFTVPEGTMISGNCVTPPWPEGSPCCTTFKVYVIQAGYRNVWEKVTPPSGDTYYREIPATDKCSQSNCNGGSTLGLGGEQNCVVSGATSEPQLIGHWTKSPAGCPQVWEYNPAASVTGVNFIELSTIDFRSDGTIYAEINSTNHTTSTRMCQIPTKLGSVMTDYFTIYQCAGGSTPTPPTPTQCQVQMALNTVPATGGNLNVGTWYSVGECTKPTSLTYVDGDGNFLLSTSVSSDGNIYANVSQNQNVSSRTSRYSITYGSSTAYAYITQQGATPPACTCSNANVGSLTTHDYDNNVHNMASIVEFTASCDASFSVVHSAGSNIVAGTPTVVSYGNNYYQVLANIQENTEIPVRTETFSIMAGGSSCATFTIGQLGSCSSSNYSTNGIIVDYIDLDVYQYQTLTINYPNILPCWTAGIVYLEGESTVQQEVFGTNAVILYFQDNLPIRYYLTFTNKSNGRVVRTQEGMITFS